MNVSLFEIFLELADVSFEELQGKTGISEFRLREIAWANVVPTKEEIFKISQVLGLDLEPLLGPDKEN